METQSFYVVDDDPSRVDLDAVWKFLSTEAYWGRWRTREMFEHQIRTAWRVVAAYEIASGNLVGFMRALSDGCTIAYLADVFVLPEHRGHGLSVRMLSEMIDEGPGARFRWMLHTRDAHGLYAKFGFGPPGPRLVERPAQIS